LERPSAGLIGQFIGLLFPLRQLADTHRLEVALSKTSVNPT